VTVKVVDASALAAISFQEAAATEMFKRLDGHDLCAPALLRFEMINVCRKKLAIIPTSGTSCSGGIENHWTSRSKSMK
jgi:uncharacterized protein with PIN domain